MKLFLEKNKYYDIVINTFCSGIFLPAAAICMILFLIIPMPSFLMDFALSLSLVLSVLVLVVSFFVESPSDFSSFPSIILLLTIYRLSLEVGTTRLILSDGASGPFAAGHVVAAFGSFLMGGDLVIGVILFLILLSINFVVITKGSGRIAEVAARFSLDAMPGKQMAIDAELNSGAIDEAEALRRRRALEIESSFFGTMDGAAKFVRGDAIASVIIAAVNILGGLGIGVIKHHLSFYDALLDFTTLTIGDGLVAQIPAILISTAAGIVVTKAGKDERMGSVIGRQLQYSEKPLFIAMGVSFFLSAIPGLPVVSFIFLGAALGVLGWFRVRSKRAVSQPAVAEDVADLKPDVVVIPPVDPLRIELGINVLPIFSGEASAATFQIKNMRKKVADEMGFILPPVRIQDNLRLGSQDYRISVREVEAAVAAVRIDKLMALDPRGGVPNIEGEKTTEPTFGLDACWIAPAQREEALVRGYTVVDPVSVIMTHLAEVVKENFADMLSFSEVERILSSLTDGARRISDEILPSQISFSLFHRLLQSMVAEHVSIRDMTSILEATQEAISLGFKNVPQILAHVRQRLARQISHAVTGNAGVIPAITLGALWEDRFSQFARPVSTMGAGSDAGIALPPREMTEFVDALRKGIDTVFQHAELPVIVVDGAIRVAVRAIVERVKPAVPVISFAEIYPRVKIKTFISLS